jgi:FkbM family methyltransferase
MNVVAFSDNNSAKWDSIIDDLAVVKPTDIINTYGDDVLCIISIWSPGHSYKQTKAQLLGLEICNIVPAAALMQLFPNELLPHYHFQTPRYFYDRRDSIREVYEFLNDEVSKNQYVAHINCRIQLDFELLPEADVHHQYFPDDVLQLTDQEVFLDAGAFTGDTLIEFNVKTSGAFSKYIALEPDPVNYEKLKLEIADLGLNNVTALPVAIGSQNQTLKFNATGGGGAGIATDGEIEVTCVRVDDAFANEPITYFKLDIEGAELDALQGAEMTITTCKPLIAVCIYHLPDDIITIPIYLKNKYPFYKFYARTHQFDGLDFVLYAIPK